MDEHSVLPWHHGFGIILNGFWCYLRPVRGCTSGGCDRAGGATICLGLLTFVLDLANSNRMVCGRSGSNRTPCCKKTWCETLVRGAPRVWTGWQETQMREKTSFSRAKSFGQVVKLTGGRKVGCFGWFSGLLQRAAGK